MRLIRISARSPARTEPAGSPWRSPARTQPVGWVPGPPASREAGWLSLGGRTCGTGGWGLFGWGQALGERDDGGDADGGESERREGHGAAAAGTPRPSRRRRKTRSRTSQAERRNRSTARVTASERLTPSRPAWRRRRASSSPGRRTVIRPTGEAAGRAEASMASVLRSCTCSRARAMSSASRTTAESACDLAPAPRRDGVAAFRRPTTLRGTLSFSRCSNERLRIRDAPNPERARRRAHHSPPPASPREQPSTATGTAFRPRPVSPSGGLSA
jgi:hypothetical protein